MSNGPKMRTLHGYEIPLNRQDFIEIERELLRLDDRDDDASDGRRETLLYVLEESVRVYQQYRIGLLKLVK